jgi:glucokinase
MEAVGIDIGGTKMAVALVNTSGLIIKRAVLATEAGQGFGRAVDRLADCVRGMLGDTGQGAVTGIGIGCAGPLDPTAGIINNPYTLTGWSNCDIVTPLSRRFGVPVRLENDADVAALGECAWGAGAGFDPVVMLTFGTGVGGAAVVQGRIYRGANGEHPELGHIPISSNGLECYCGIRGCLESIASGSAMAAAGRPRFADARSLFAAAAGGDDFAAGVVDRAVQAAAMAAWTLCHTFLPERIVLGGGIMDDQFELFARGMRKHLGTATQFSRKSVSIAKASLGSDAGIVGAASLFLPGAVRGPAS